MIAEPEIVERGYRPYVALRRTTDTAGIPALVDAGFPALFAHLAACRVEPVGPPFIRYRAMTPGAMDLDLGVPYGSGVDDDGWTDPEVSVDRLPAGRHAHIVHTGPFDGLVAAHAAIDDWAERTGQALDADLGARVEHYRTDPRAEPDPTRWVTEVEEPLFFGRRPVEVTALDGCGLLVPGLAGDGDHGRLHRGVQCAQRRSPALVPLPPRARGRLRRRHHRAPRGDEVALLTRPRSSEHPWLLSARLAGT